MPNDIQCTNCRLAATRTQIVFPTPCPPGGLLAIGEAAGAEEDTSGEGFVGPAGRRLDALLKGFGCMRGTQYGVANIVRCRPPENRKPDDDEIDACIPFLAHAIASMRPRVLLLVGNTAAKAFLGSETLFAKVAQSRRNTHCDFTAAHSTVLADTIRTQHADLWETGIDVVPMPHTSGLSWNRKAPDGRPWSAIGIEQMRLAVSLLGIVVSTETVPEITQTAFDF